MPGALSLREEGFIPEEYSDCVFRMNTENEWVVSEASVKQKPVSEMLQARSLHQSISVLLLTVLLAQCFCRSCFHVFMKNTREEGHSTRDGRLFNRKLWACVTISERLSES